MNGRAIVLRGDARNLPLPDESVDLIVTSPPYWALRDYRDGDESLAGQIGAEASPGEYLESLWECTREWMRVLKPEGSLWINLGDKYSTGNSGQSGMAKLGERWAGGGHSDAAAKRASQPVPGMAPKSLLGLPWMYAAGCTGGLARLGGHDPGLNLILRAEVIWAKPNGLPESVTDRVRRSHEQWFHFVKQPRYYSAVDEIREPSSGYARRPGAQRATPPGQRRRAMADTVNPLGPLPGSVWEVATQPLSVPERLDVAHHAAFPMELPRRIIRGWSPPGICTGCGEGRRPIVASTSLDMSRPQARRALDLVARHGLTDEHIAAVRAVGVSDTGRGAATQSGTGKNTADVYALAEQARAALGGYAREFLLQRPTGFCYVCACAEPDAPTRPAIVLDPFGGTGTAALVASTLGRHGISVDRSADYCRLAAWRTTDPGERARALGLPKPPPPADGQERLFEEIA